jgi:N-methylhydantoinase B
MLTGHKIVTATLRAFATVLPDRIPAAYYGVTFNHAVGIIHADGSRQVYFDAELGGWGAHPEQDGADGLSAGFHNQQNTPIEMIESLYPLTFTRYGLVPDSGGAGRHRGGLGIVREWRFDGHRGLLNASFDAFQSRPYGLAGGEPGSVGRLAVTRDGATRELPPKVIGHELKAGDVVRMELPGGGGHGDPAARDPAALAADLAGSYVTAAGGTRYIR